MLSRVAERMYWFGRYIERAENTALLVNVNTNLVMDLPRVKHIWASLVDITGDEAAYFTRYTNVNEQNIVKFLLEGDQSSVRAAIAMARKNARTSREIMPNEAWEKVNKLYHYVNAMSAKGLNRMGRHDFLSGVSSRCQELTGYLAGCMSTSAAYNFIKIGRNLERADMTTRILDVGCYNLSNPDLPEIKEYEDILWTNLLMSLSGYQMYRQHVDDRVNGEDVADFLLHDTSFPRGAAHCLNEVANCAASLPRNDNPLRATSHAQRKLATSDIINLYVEGSLHDFIDELQRDFAEIHQEITSTWFTYDEATVEVVQA